MRASPPPPDVEAVLEHLKDFQRDTVDYVFRRMFLDASPTQRFLVADEVGLGKTLVARGVIARAIDHLWDRVDRLDVVYICSNSEIARQNIRRLRVADRDDIEFELASRITLLPVTLKKLKQRKLNFISFTPGTSFELKSNLGWAKERVLLYWLLHSAWGLRGTGPKNVLQGQVDRGHFRDLLDDFKRRNEIDPTLRDDFILTLERHDEALQHKGEPGLREQFADLCKRFRNPRSAIPEADWKLRRDVIGDFRALLAATCIEALEPDLIILDEFQRFKNLLDGEDEAARLARVLFEYSGVDSRAHVLLLSATPYKMYTLTDDAEAGDHYEDFIRTLRFLVSDPAEGARLETLLTSYREELLRLPQGGSDRLREIKEELQEGLLRVMVRTERLAVSEDRNGMLAEVTAPDLSIGAPEASAYRALQRVARELEHADTLEYWKTAPFLLNFMDGYKLKEKFKTACEKNGGDGELAQAVSQSSALLLPWKTVRDYQPLDPENARLRWLLQDTVERGAWRLLWIPPSLPYYQPEGPFAEAALKGFTKRLVFSSWRVAPKVLATLLSYEAERRMITLLEPNANNTPKARERRRGLLRFSISEDRPVGMPVLALLYPSAALSLICDPMHLPADSAGSGALPTRATQLKQIQALLTSSLEPLRAMEGGSGPVDESWYWAAPILLDLLLNENATREWWDAPNLALVWSGGEPEGEVEDAGGWAAHVTRACEVLSSQRKLGPMPPDLPDVLALSTLASPGVAALRALARGAGSAACWNPGVRNRAAQIAWGFRSVFNLPETMGLLRGMNAAEPYWMRVLEYCSWGNLQAVLDEFVHVLRESLGLLDQDPEAAAQCLAEAMIEALSLRTANIGYDDVRVGRDGRVSLSPRRMRARFAVRFGVEESDEGGKRTRSEQVRTAFNSPFWPFVLATTSVGQEGLDFHPYCHAVVHWNLPSNPVDLEQREGRVHRYKGHAVRKNVATKYGGQIHTTERSDPWKEMFERASSERQAGENDIQPFWIFSVPGGAKIERHVPAVPLSRDEQMLAALKRSLVVYRMVFGQPRQEDLLAYLLTRMPREQVLQHLADLQIDLQPPKP